MFSPVFAPNTPEWLLITALILSLGSFFVLLIWATILEVKYVNPFTLIKRRNREKWNKATQLAVMYTAMIPVFGLAQPIISPHPDQFPMFSLFCGGVWIVVLPIAILYKRWEFERHIKSYRYFDKQIKDKDSVYNYVLARPLRLMSVFAMTAEQRRFYKEGFPEDFDEDHEGANSE
jgi:hypothetical protein